MLHHRSSACLVLPLCLARRASCVGLCFLFAATLPALSAQALTGSISGRIYNPATREYVRNAEVRVAGTALLTETESDGTFSFPGVPVGTVTLTVTYTGYTAAPDTFNVSGGQTAVREIVIASTLTAAGKGATDEPLKLSAFVVSHEREGNAKAIMEQRRNMNISTSVAADTFGDVTEGNVGEFLKYLPGVEVEYVDGISRGPRVGGLDQQYVGVTMDGAAVASADAFVAYGSTLNGAAGSQSRSVGFEQMSINSVESIEVSRTLSPDMQANSPAGSINMRTRRAFDRKGRRVDWQFSAGFNTPDAANFGQTHGWDDNLRRQWRPNYQVDYSDVFLNQRLGVRLSVSNSSIRSEQQYVTHTYNKTTVPTGATPDLRPMVLTGMVFTDGPRLSSRANITATTDFKATNRLVLSLTAMFNAFENNAHTKALTFNAAANGVVAATGRQNVLGDGLTEIRTNGLAANTSRTMTYGGGTAIKLTNSFTLTPKFEYKFGGLTLDGTANFSRSKNDYETSTRGSIRTETLNALTADFRATRPNANSAEWTIVQTGGADWSNLANYTNPRSNEEGRFAFTEIYTAETNAKYVLPWRIPTFLKFGGKWAEENRKTENATPYLVYSYIGPGGNILNANGTITTTGTFAAFPSPRPFNTNMGDIRALTIANPPPLTNRSAVSLLYREHPEYFVNIATAENYYTAYVANHRDFRQHVTAGYGMANTRLGKLQLQGGVRWELTESESREFDPLTAAQVALKYPISTATRRATTLEGMQYQFFSQPRVSREGDYANFFPSASLKYSLRPNLQAQVGYSYAISRPPVDALAGVWSINDQALLITAPNPNLKPEKSDNYVARLAYYFEPVGSFTFLVQQTEISDQRVTVRGKAADFGFENDPDYATYEFQSLTNNNTLYRYRSLELAYNQNLSFLPGFLRTTNVNVSYTRNYANQYFPGVTPHKVSGAIGWSFRALSLRAGAVWQDDTPFTTVFGRYQRHNLKLDLSGGYKLSARTSLFFQGRNILNDPHLLYEGDPTRNIPAALYRFGNYGVSWSLGIKGNF
ncbi:MAG: TonB-dependent receptor [Opitutaceae bacterium]|nr:TonB-dependent receptor [Opitutaceae bacterium]